MKKATIALLLICVAAFAQQKGSFTDTRDKKTYKTVKIGEQTWMAENLNYDAEGSRCYGEGGEAIVGWKDGENITRKLSDAEIRANCTKYGRLYDWNAAMKACPNGWHLPSVAEWQTLVKFAGGYEVVQKKLKAKSGWKENDFVESYKSYKECLEGFEQEEQDNLSKKKVSYKRNSKAPKCKWTEEKMDNRGQVKVTEHDECTTDEYGFSALPGGYGYFGYSDGLFYSVGAGSDSDWWRSTTENSNGRNCVYPYSMSYNIEYDCPGGGDDDGCRDKSNLYSVRCIQGWGNDNSTADAATVHEEQKEFEENGKLKSVNNYKDGKKHGEWKEFYKNGKLQYVSNYKDGKFHGEWKEFYENGNVKEVGNYINGKGQGEWKGFHENGNLKMVGNQTDDEWQGECKFFYENGNLERVANFKDGKGQGEWKEFYKNGKLKMVANFKDGKPHGEVKEFYENGNLKSVKNFKNGVQQWR